MKAIGIGSLFLIGIGCIFFLMVLFAEERVEVAVRAAEVPEFDGVVEPFMVVNLGSSADGVLDTVTVDRGDEVKKGQVLATIESSVEKATMDLAEAKARFDSAVKTGEARVEFSVRKFIKNQDLFTDSIISMQELDDSLTEKVLADLNLVQAQESLQLAKLEYRQASAAYLLRIIRSPIDGVVVERFLSPGELLSRMSQLKIMKLAQLDPLRVEVIVPVAYLTSVAVGGKAEVRLEAPVGGVHTAEVKVVDRVVDAASGTFGVRLEMPNPDRRLPAGLKCKVRFVR